MSVVEGYHLGHNTKWVWLQVPRSEDYPDWPMASTVLTLPRDVLSLGFATSRKVLLEIDYASLHNDGVHWVADVEFLEVLSGKDDP